ncbi:MAG: glycosyltransferase [Clostridia bacterium]|nr:glycosyltransferase [Clostridia bacterium]
MKHIIIVLHSLAVGGAERRLSSVANYIAAQGHRVTMLLIDNPVVKFEVDPRIKVVCVNQSPDHMSDYDPEKCELFRLPKPANPTFLENARLRAQRALHDMNVQMTETELYLKYRYAVPLREYIRQYPDAIVVSFMTTPNISTMMAVRDLPNRALFGDCTDASAEFPADSPYHVLRKKYYRRADGAILQTDAQRENYGFLPDIPKSVIPNFIRGDHLPDRFAGTRKKEIVTFCRLSPVKNIPLLFDAFSMLYRDHPEYVLSIYGEGGIRDELKNRADALHLADSVHFYDFDLNIHDKIKDAAMFVSSSDREGISNSMLEAMAIGLPCVCTDCAGGGARMMIDDHVNGLLVPIKDVNALYHAMKEVVENPELAEAMSRNAVKIKDRLRPEVICRQMLDAILGEAEQ